MDKKIYDHQNIESKWPRKTFSPPRRGKRATGQVSQKNSSMSLSEKSYDHQRVESKWQKYWDKNKIYEAKDDEKREKFYGLIEFPYPSGDGLHTGHLRSNTAMDIICRKRRMEGFNVLYPIGFDSFGLPAENYAIKVGVKPQVSIAKNIETFTRQLKACGFGFDWSRSFTTTDQEYYKWTQWIFIKMFEKGLAYKEKRAINWCVSCKIGLANEEVVDGKCERCGGEVVKKEKEQWILKITEYADRLIEDLDKVDYLDRIKTQQINWIGKSFGTEFSMEVLFRGDHKILATAMSIKEEARQAGEMKGVALEKAGVDKPEDAVKIRVYTTRVDTVFGMTYAVLAPEHPLVKSLTTPEQKEEVEKYIEQSKKISDLERTAEARPKTGVFTGSFAVNPVNNQPVQIWVGDYVLADYGTGAIMAVPAHDERDFSFAEKHDLEIVEVIKSKEGNSTIEKEAFTEDGILVGSGEFSGLTSAEAREKITQWLEERGLGIGTKKYKLHDWIFSRQRYWGEPIPMVYCEKCSWRPVPENQLPVVLPDIDDFMPTEEGESPLIKAKDWVNAVCPKCGGPARRETDVMPNWAGSNWYFVRYADPKNGEMMIDPDKAKYWLPVDWYNGGMEHTTLHLLYSRFVYKFLYDIGAVPAECGSEPYAKRTAHGMILGEGGEKMSKSRGNVINPDQYLEKFGADTVRIYEMFMGPFDQAIAWSDQGVTGAYRFLQKVWNLAVNSKFKIQNSKLELKSENLELKKIIHKTIKKVSEDIENMRFNTAVSAMMILANEMEKLAEFPVEDLATLALILSPFAPHLAEELWSTLNPEPYTLNAKYSVFQEMWPQYDPALIVDKVASIAVQVNGKVRDTVEAPIDISQEDLLALAQESPNVRKNLEGKEIKKVIYVPGKLLSLVVG